MIHVTAQPEPESFNTEVRQKGLAWLKKKKISLNQPLPPKTHLRPFWRECIDDLHKSYEGCCAYLAVFIERVTGGASVDHFIAKSQRVALVYEWNNYRLACSRMNSRKREFDDVLDPFEVETGWFYLEPVTGRIYANPQLQDPQKQMVDATIKRLGLDDANHREMRARHYQEFGNGLYTEDFLKKYSPFVWSEVKRQGLL
jgi:uncharacterized protein (TIGR02646 family)